MEVTAKELIRRYVFEACEAGSSPDPRESAHAFALDLKTRGLIEVAVRTARRYVRFAVQDYIESASDADPAIIGEIQHRFSYDEVADLYSFWPPGARRAFAVEGEHIRAMKRQYSNPPMGDGLTMNHVAQAWGISRDVFAFIKRELGWTKDQDEFTSEEHLSRTALEMLRDREMRSRGALHRLSAKKQHEQVKADAAKWRAFRESILDEVRAGFASPVQLGELARNDGDRMLVLSPSDLHIGKRGLDDELCDTYGAVLDTTRELAAMGVEAGATRGVLVLGNDWGHVDTPARTTTAGTPQDSASLRRVVRESVRTARDLVVEAARWFQELELLVIPSNHSKAGDLWMVEVLAALFGDVEGISASVSTAERQYRRFGVNLLGFEHGDGAKEGDLGAIMARERACDWGSSLYRYWHIGHMHHLRERDVGGAVVCMAPSLATTDRWHDKKGYLLSQRANVGYLYDAQAGQVARYLRNYG